MYIQHKLFLCSLCRGQDSKRFCKQFIKMDVEARFKVVNKHRYFVNCFAKSHDLRARICKYVPKVWLVSSHVTTSQSKVTSDKQRFHQQTPEKPLIIRDERITSEVSRSSGNVLCGKPSSLNSNDRYIVHKYVLYTIVVLCRQFFHISY